MKIERFIVALTTSDKFIELQPDPEGSLCFASDVAKLEAKCAELLEAAKNVVGCWDGSHWEWDEHIAPLIDRLRAAIAKAEGGSDE